MKRKKVLSTVISCVLLLSMSAVFTACGDNESTSQTETTTETKDEIEKLPDNFVDYTDSTSGISYTYNNAYVMSFDNADDVEEMKSYNIDYYNQMLGDRTTYVNRYPDAQYYRIRTKKNEFNDSSSIFVYSVDGKTLDDRLMSEISDEDYKIFSNSIKTQLESALGEVEEDTSEKYLTFGDNQYMHVKFTFDMIGRPYIYEQFLFQLDDGTVAKFVFQAYESQYDFAFEQVSQILESMKLN